jgi:hypothetical protein
MRFTVEIEGAPKQLTDAFWIDELETALKVAALGTLARDEDMRYSGAQVAVAREEGADG